MAGQLVFSRPQSMQYPNRAQKVCIAVPANGIDIESHLAHIIADAQALHGDVQARWKYRPAAAKGESKVVQCSIAEAMLLPWTGHPHTLAPTPYI